MQEDMRLTLPAAVPEKPEAERPEVRVMLYDDGKGERGFVRFHPVPGTPLVIRPEDWMPKADPVQVRMIPQRGLTPEQEERATVTIMAAPGEVVTLYATDWTAAFEPGVHVAREHWKRGIFRSATGVILGARPHPGSDEEIFVDMPEATARWVARQILAALAEPAEPARLVADEGYWKGGSTLDETREAVAKTAARFETVAETRGAD